MATVEYKAEKLSSNNYSVWKTVMTSALMGKDLWSVVIEESANTDELKLKNEQAKHLMYVSMEPQQIAATGVCQTAHSLWLKIKENHEGAEANLKSIALSEFMSIRFQKKESIVGYAGRFEMLLGRLLTTDHKVDEATKLWVFSNSLPSHMRTTVQIFTMANPKGSVAELITCLKNQYHTADQEEETAYHTQSGNNSNRKWPSQGEQDSKPKYNKPDGSKKNPVTCTFCKFNGHSWKDCRKLKARNEQKKQALSTNQKEEEVDSSFMARETSSTADKFHWIIDSGASKHMTSHREFMTNYKEFDSPLNIYMGNGEHMEAYGRGDIEFMSQNFQVCRAIKQGCTVNFKNNPATVDFVKKNKLMLQGHPSSNGFFVIRMRPLRQEKPPIKALTAAALADWHHRFAHCSVDAIRELSSKNAVSGLKITDNSFEECKGCGISKICRTPHPSKTHLVASKDNAVIHLDTCDMKIKSLGGNRYFVLGVEEYSNYKYLCPVANKSNITDVVKAIIVKSELDSKRIVKMIVSDNGSEFTNNQLEDWLSKRGIIHSYSTTYTPQQNGLVERGNRVVIEGVRTLLASSMLPETLWAEAALNVVYTTNRMLSPHNKMKTRYELHRGEKPDVGNLRRFGQPAIVRKPDVMIENKLQPKGEYCHFVGYTERFNTYRFFTPLPRCQVFSACDVKFRSDSQLIKNFARANAQAGSTIRLELDNNTPPTKSPVDSPDIPDEISTVSSDEYQSGEDTTANSSQELESTEEPERRVTRSTAREHAGCQRALFTLDNEPQNVKEAQSSPDWQNWQQAMAEEISALDLNKTWTFVDRPTDKKPIKNKWVFKIKMTPDGEVERYKARLVAKGFTQIPNVDYKETYAPVASMITIRFLFAYANQKKMEIRQFDIKTAFLHGELEEQLFMECPEGYSVPGKVCKLLKSIYGLKQAPRNWNQKFDTFLKQFQLEQSESDKCLYFNSDRTLLLTIYVDDGLVAAVDRDLLDRLIEYLKKVFELKVMECEAYLGFKVIQDKKNRTISLSQAHYIERMLEKFQMQDCLEKTTPEIKGAKFDESPLLPNDNKFKELVGSLLYLSTCTRPDIAHAVSVASRTSQPTVAHWNALKRVLQYLKGAKDWCVTFRWEESNGLHAYSDADYANDSSRKSTTGFCIYFGGGPIAWRCQRQQIITLSTTEAEYVAGCELVKELIPLRETLIELGEQTREHPTPVYIDNLSAVRVASNDSGHQRTKHIDIREKWLTQHAQKNTITIKHVSGDNQAADILTKPLPKQKFASNRARLLTLLAATLALVMTCSAQTTNASSTRVLKLTDILTTVPSDIIYVSGDERYKLTNIIYNPCPDIYNESAPPQMRGRLRRLCEEAYSNMILKKLSNCDLVPSPESDSIDLMDPDCISQANKESGNKNGKCQVVTHQVKPSRAQTLLELDRLEKEWNKHKETVRNLPHLRREKRIIPLITLAAIAVMLGTNIKTYKIANTNTENIEGIVNVTEAQSRVIKDSTMFLDQYCDSIKAIHEWAESVEERLGDDPLKKEEKRDGYYGAKANELIQTYRTWFQQQERLLREINTHAASKRIPKDLKFALNTTGNFAKMATHSHLFECRYRLEKRSMYLDLDFSIPRIPENGSCSESGAFASAFSMQYS